MSEQNTKFPLNPVLVLIISGLFLSTIVYTIHDRENESGDSQNMRLTSSESSVHALYAKAIDMLDELEEGEFADFDAEAFDELEEIALDINEAHKVVDQLQASGVDSLQAIGSKILAELTELQTYEFPLLRRLYAADLLDHIDEDTESVAVLGDISDQFEMWSPRAATKEDAVKLHESMIRALLLFRFKEAVYKDPNGQEIARFAIDSKGDLD